MVLRYTTTPGFDKQFKKLSKRFRSLPGDLETAKSAAIELTHVKGKDNQSCFRLKQHEHPSIAVYKIKKFTCKSLKGKGVRSGIRIIYAFHPHVPLIEFIEIYYKQDQENERTELITQYLEEHVAKTSGEG